MELPEALHDLKRAALANIAKRNGFSTTDTDIEFGLRANSTLQGAFNSLLAREASTVRFSYAVRPAFRKMTDWYSDR